MTRFRGIPFAPAEGWLTVGLVALTVLTFAWSVDAATWILRDGELTDFLSGAAFLSVMYGFAAAKAGWSRWTVHVVGAAFAALIVPLMIGGTLAPDQPWGKAYEATSGAMVQAWLDLAVRGKSVTPQHGHFMLVLGLAVWATGQFAGYTTFGHRRPLSAMTIVGIVLLFNMSVTVQDHLWYLVVFTLAALLLLVRFHAFDEQSAWFRRRIGDPAAVAGIYLRGGTAFVAATVILALGLTGTAKSAPLAGAWGGVDQRLIEFSRQFQGLLQTWGGTRISGVSFGPNADLGLVWDTSGTPAFEAVVAPGDRQRYYWRVYTYDEFNGRSWQLSATDDAARAPGSPLLADDALDQPAEVGTRELRFTINPLEYSDDELIAPKTLVQVDVQALVRTLGPDGFYGTVQRSTGKGSYTAVARVPVTGEDPGELNKGALRGAPTEYPSGIVERYAAKPIEGTLGPEARKLLAEVLEATPNQNPYDIAATMEQEFFHDQDRFTYDANIADVDCVGRTPVECFAWNRRGFCMQYATTMAMLLRELGIPARLAQGFLPGERNTATGVETVTFGNAHAWVEVYFPGFGWVDFDPTGNGLSQLGALPAGVDPSPRPSGATPFEPEESEFARGSASVPADAGETPAQPSDAGAAPYIAVTILLLITVGALAFLAYRRGPKGSQPDTIYGGIVRLASRLGFAPRPTQTVYEYTGALGELVPTARPELSTVAQAKVEVAYGRQSLGDDRLRALMEAQRRLRVQLLRLLFRRRQRRRR